MCDPGDEETLAYAYKIKVPTLTRYEINRVTCYVLRVTGDGGRENKK